MSSKFFIGAQWGDEGKGRIIDWFASQNPSVVVRYQGGPNAGHTVYIDGVKYVTHQLPTGCIRTDTINIIGNGCVINPSSILEELEELEEKGVSHDKNSLEISSNVHLITPKHIQQDRKKNQHRLGTTGKGIGPCYVSKYERNGIRLVDVAEAHSFEDLNLELSEENLNFFESAKEISRRFMQDITKTLLKYQKDNKLQILYEGAQGFDLDIDHGTYPYVSTSNPSIGGAYSGTGVFIPFEDRVGIMKAYLTRVGEGPFPTEACEESSKFLQEQGKEYGATTGRPRKCGWLDLFQIKRAVIANGLNQLIMTKLDVFDGLDSFNVCVDYYGDDPIFKTYKGWGSNYIQGTQTFSNLPHECQNFVHDIEKQLNVPITFVSTGPNRKDLIVRK